MASSRSSASGRDDVSIWHYITGHHGFAGALLSFESPCVPVCLCFLSVLSLGFLVTRLCCSLPALTIGLDTGLCCSLPALTLGLDSRLCCSLPALTLGLDTGLCCSLPALTLGLDSGLCCSPPALTLGLDTGLCCSPPALTLGLDTGLCCSPPVLTLGLDSRLCCSPPALTLGLDTGLCCSLPALTLGLDTGLCCSLPALTLGLDSGLCCSLPALTLGLDTGLCCSLPALTLGLDSRLCCSPPALTLDLDTGLCSCLLPSGSLWIPVRLWVDGFGHHPRPPSGVCRGFGMMGVGHVWLWKMLWMVMILLRSDLGTRGSESPDCSERRDDPACLDFLVAMPPQESNCDGPVGCRLHFLPPEDFPTLEELRELQQEPHQEFKQTLKQTGSEGGTKQHNPKSKSVTDRLTLVESNLISMNSRIQKLQEESKVNLSRIEDRLNSLAVLILGILSGCELPCNESVQKLSVLESRRLKTLETKEDFPLSVKGVGNTGSPVDSSEKPERLFPRDCAEIYKQGIRENGIYTIQPIPLRQPFEAYCDMVTDVGGWTVIQRRQDGAVDFNRTWQDYKQGFGTLSGEHWLGNEHLHSLTKIGQHTLRIELEDWYGVKRYAVYRKFKVASEQNKYRLTAREYQGNAGNAMSYSRNYNHDHKYFTTNDSDNDNYPSGNCGMYYGAGWWFDTCLAANLNGKYYKGRYSGVTNGIYWGTWYILTDKRTNQKYSFKKVEMKTRILTV
ncbi:uncharacterized protein WCC33_008905 [Rhinophrynus dorsalis]